MKGEFRLGPIVKPTRSWILARLGNLASRDGEIGCLSKYRHIFRLDYIQRSNFKSMIVLFTVAIIYGLLPLKNPGSLMLNNA